MHWIRRGEIPVSQYALTHTLPSSVVFRLGVAAEFVF
jgi:hypothetical protein